MIILKGESLAKRQQELNIKVAEAVKANISFETVKNAPEMSDIDNLFKIDVASKLKKLDYIIEILKSGDSLHISRALRCEWMYDDEYSNTINPDYLHFNIFPAMAPKMKNKTLSAISSHVRNETRAENFYDYCLRIGLKNIASKFLLFSSESFKLKIIKTDKFAAYKDKEDSYWKHFIGNSFVLADAYLETASENFDVRDTLIELRHLYSVSNAKYLQLLEYYINTRKYNRFSARKFGLRMSNDIAKKHKQRIRANPVLYMQLLHKVSVTKYSTIDDAKVYATALMPEKAKLYWAEDFYSTYKYFVDIIPFEQRLRFLKQLFNSNYSDEPFEMALRFYSSRYYNLMTVEEREKWALNHINSNEEILGSKMDYLWYQFVSYDKAIVAIKKYISVTSENDKRADMLNTLIESTKNETELAKLLKYYIERHINESKSNKECFIDTVIRKYNIFELQDECWELFNKLFYSLDVYNPIDYNSKIEYRIISFIYYILHDLELPEAILKLIDTKLNFYTLKTFTSKLYKHKEDFIYGYLYNYYIEKLLSVENIPYSPKIQLKVREYIVQILSLMSQYDKKPSDLPEVVSNFIELDQDSFSNHEWIRVKPDKFNENILMHQLKQNAKLAILSLPLVKQHIKDTWNFRLNNFVKKLKIYFSDDLAKDFLNFFVQMLGNENDLSLRSVYTVVYGIFQISDEIFKNVFMTKYAPTDGKIDRSAIDRNTLYIQESICRFACYSRPPVPLSNMLLYIKGDYVHFCMPMFNLYYANLPLPQCVEFIKALLNMPVSIQKHALRLAFKSFSTENLTKLILDTWKKTKNVSCRKILYEYLLKKIHDNNDEGDQKIFFGVLKTLTLDLHDDDADEVFELLSSKMPECFAGEFLEAAWAAVNKLSPEQKISYLRESYVIGAMEREILHVKLDTILTIVNEHVHNLLINTNLRPIYESNEGTLYDTKWSFIREYITNCKVPVTLSKKFDLISLIIQLCVTNWSTVHKNRDTEEVFTYRQFLFTFIENVHNKHMSMERYKSLKPIIELFLYELQNLLPIEDIYLVMWELKFSFVIREAMDNESEFEKNVSLATLKKFAVKYGVAIGDLMMKLDSTNIFYRSFLTQITAKAISVFYRLYSAVNTASFRCEILYSHIAEGLLTTYNFLEAHLMAVEIIGHVSNPVDLSHVVNLIRSSEHKEVLCYFNQKFIFSDFKKRPFV